MSSRKRPPPNLLDPDSDSDSAPTTKKRPYHQKPPLPTTTTTTPPPTTTTHESDDEDDYMNMCIPEPTAPETLLQRQKRLAREAEERAHPKSKAELRAQEAAKREEALSQSLLTTNPANKGLRMMRAMGFTPGSALGASPSTTTTSTAATTAARTEPIPVAIKTDRAGIGHPGKQPPHPQPSISAEQRDALLSPEEYRARVAGEQEERRREAQVLAAQKIAEGLADGAAAAKRTRTLRGVNVLWRGMVLRREVKEAEARMRYELSTGLGTSGNTPGDIDDGDGGAVGGAMRQVVVEDGDEELDEVVDNDEELAAFEALGAAERLQRLCEFLRGEYRYCFWCKCGYEDEAMEGCPGVEEDLHG